MERLVRLITRKTPSVKEVAMSTTGVPQSEPVITLVHLDKGESEVLDQERKQWESSYLGRDFLGKREYVVSLALRDDPSKRIYAALGINSLGVEIDIPLTEPTPQEELVKEAYLEATLFGEIDPEKYHDFATDSFTKDDLLAFLNRKMADAVPDDVPDWFYTTFDVTHLEKYGSVYIGSHGGAGEYGYDFNATISPTDRRRYDANLRDETEETSIWRANDFAQVVKESLPHIDVTPLAVATYLQDVQSTLRFLPRDWEA